MNLWEKADLITPMAIRVVATLRIADLLERGIGRLDQIAEQCRVDRDALGRVLRYLADREILKETKPERFEMTEACAPLLSDHPSGMRDWLDLEGFGGWMDTAFVDLLTAVRTGRSPHRRHKPDLDPALADSYDSLMASQSRGQAPLVTASYDWSDVGHVVDVGGGTGAQLAEILRRNSDLRGTLVELPSTAATARELFAAAGLAPRCQVVAGSLFEAELPRADAYLLAFVLHGFDDPEAAEALSRCAKAGGKEARVLVIERTLLPEDPDRTAFSSMDLRMLILGQGRERTLEEYNALAERAGLAFTSVSTLANRNHLIEYRPFVPRS